MEKEICEYCNEEIENPEDIIRMPPDNGPVCYNCSRWLVEVAAPSILEQVQEENRLPWQQLGF